MPYISSSYNGPLAVASLGPGARLGRPRAPVELVSHKYQTAAYRMSWRCLRTFCC